MQRLVGIGKHYAEAHIEAQTETYCGADTERKREIRGGRQMASGIRRRLEAAAAAAAAADDADDACPDNPTHSVLRSVGWWRRT